MKKSIIVLVLIFFISGLLFGATGDKLILKVKVGEVKPSFEIYGNTTIKGTNLGSDIDWRDDSNKDPSANNVVLPITLKHFGVDELGVTQNFIRYKLPAGVDLTVSASKLVNEVTGDESSLPVASTITLKATIADKFEITSTGEGSNIVKVTPKYISGRPVYTNLDGGVIASWNYTWSKDEDLPNGDYKAEIILTYTAV